VGRDLVSEIPPPKAGCTTSVSCASCRGTEAQQRATQRSKQRSCCSIVLSLWSVSANRSAVGRKSSCFSPLLIQFERSSVGQPTAVFICMPFFCNFTNSVNEALPATYCDQTRVRQAGTHSWILAGIHCRLTNDHKWRTIPLLAFIVTGVGSLWSHLPT